MSATPRFAVVLSGCGVFDGAEIHESVLSMLAIDRHGGTYDIFAPDVPQMHVINHLTGQVAESETRNVRVEAARIARGDVKELGTYRAADYDALLFPGGFGAAKNLATFAVDGPECSVNPDVSAAITGTHEAGKPIGALCISPAIMARVLGKGQMTIGSDADTANAINQLGAEHVEKGRGEVVVDKGLKLVTSPCYMLESRITQIEQGADGVVSEMMKMLG